MVGYFLNIFFFFDSLFFFKPEMLLIWGQVCHLSSISERVTLATEKRVFSYPVVLSEEFALQGSQVLPPVR